MTSEIEVCLRCELPECIDSSVHCLLFGEQNQTVAIGRQEKARIYAQRPGVRARRHEYNVAYFRRPEVIELQRTRQKEYAQKPDVKSRRRERYRLSVERKSA